MSYKFFDDFKSCDESNNACNWTVLQTSDLAHLHRQWESGKYIITAPGNRHLPNTPELSEFTLEAVFGIKDNISDLPELRIFFWYEELKRAGYFIDCRIENNQCIVSFGSEYNNTTRVIIKQSEPFDSRYRQSPWTVKLCVKPDQIEFRFENCSPFKFPLTKVSNRKGRIAFDRVGSSGVLELHQVKVTSTDKVETEVLLPETQIIFPPDLNGFHTPLRYNVQVTQLGDTARLDLEIAGSDVENPDVPWFPYHGLIMDFLTAPYLRIGEQRFYPAAGDTMVLANPDPIKHKYFYEALYQKPQWPLRASFFLAKIPEIETIGVGYEYCKIEASADHLASGPNEAIFDVATNAIAYAGAAVRKNKLILELHSQEEKEVCKHIPKTDPQYEEALTFARRNHFFIAPESCRFNVILRSNGNDFSAEDIILNCRLENAFTEELEPLAISPFQTAENTKLGFTEFISELPPLTLEPGVHHLYFEVKLAGHVIISQRHAFEIMSPDPDALAAPLLSGLPLLFTMANETKGLEKDQFEPYLNVENNTAHYLSLTTHYPAVGRKNRIDEIIKVYHRKWFLCLTNRVAEIPDMEHHKDIIAKCDYLQPPGDSLTSYDMWKPQTYRGAMLDTLIQFLLSDEFHFDNEKFLTIDNLERIKQESALFPEDAIEELVAKHWMPWLRFFERWLSQKDSDLQKYLKEINPQVKLSSYGPIQAYVAHGKTSHVLKYRGTIPKDYDGFFVFEDYPLTCKYNIHRGPFLLAALKMAVPDTAIYPETYRSIKQGCPDGAVGYAWPPLGAATHPAIAEKKRFLEYAYAAVWFKQGEFHYWQDNGYHAAAWPREYYDVMLESWKFIHQAKPLKPLRSTAYVYSDVVCENHPAFYERSTGVLPWGDIYNTAEETIPYAWETARIDGQQSGFLCELESLHEISAEDTGLLVLPPLCGVTQAQLDTIRSLHEQGVNLLAFENIDGLEDVFGVEKMEEPLAVNNIQVNTSLSDNPLHELGTLKEYTEHPLCSAKYRTSGASVLLEGEAPVLLMNHTSSGKAALFNIPPTVVRRDAFYERVAYGRGSISKLMDRAVAIMQRELGAPAVTTTAGKIVAFEAQNGERHIIVEEDAFPDDGMPITPLVTIYLPNIERPKVSCDKPFDIVFSDSNMIKIRMRLDVHECAIITIGV